MVRADSADDERRIMIKPQPLRVEDWRRSLRLYSVWSGARTLHASQRQSWIRAALLAGAAYFIVGRVFAIPVTRVHFWRLAAWLVSGAVFAAHIGYEHFRLRHSPRPTASHAALAVALGALALAVAGALHKLMATSALEPRWLLAFIVWPAATGLPAFLVALVAAAVLTRFNRRPGTNAEIR